MSLSESRSSLEQYQIQLPEVPIRYEPLRRAALGSRAILPLRAVEVKDRKAMRNWLDLLAQYHGKYGGLSPMDKEQLKFFMNKTEQWSSQLMKTVYCDGRSIVRALVNELKADRQYYQNTNYRMENQQPEKVLTHPDYVSVAAVLSVEEECLPIGLRSIASYLVGIYLTKSRRYDAAQKAWLRTMNYGESVVATETAFRLGLLALRSGQFDEAARWLRVVQQGPYRTDALLGVAWVDAQRGNCDGVLNAAQEFEQTNTQEEVGRLIGPQLVELVVHCAAYQISTKRVMAALPSYRGAVEKGLRELEGQRAKKPLRILLSDDLQRCYSQVVWKLGDTPSLHIDVLLRGGLPELALSSESKHLVGTEAQKAVLEQIQSCLLRRIDFSWPTDSRNFQLEVILRRPPDFMDQRLSER